MIENYAKKLGMTSVNQRIEGVWVEVFNFVLLVKQCWRLTNSL